MRLEGNALYLESAEVKEIPAPRLSALGMQDGSQMFQENFNGPKTSRAWKPSEDASEWNAVVPSDIVVVRLYIDGEFICNATMIDPGELREISTPS